MSKNLAQQAAFIILDATVAHGADGGSGGPMQLAIERLNEVPGIVSVTDVGTSRSVDVSPIVNASIVSKYILASWVADERGVPIEEVFGELRANHDRLWEE